jgi:hypothetical protein
MNNYCDAEVLQLSGKTAADIQIVSILAPPVLMPEI